MRKKKKRLSQQWTMILIVLLVIISATVVMIILRNSSSEPISGQAYADLSSGQKQLYWKCMTDNKCNVLLKEAQVSKDYTAYRKCAKDCSDSASNIKLESYYCTDSDGTDFLTKSKVVSNLYPQGKEDYCFTFPGGKTYLMEGICKDNKYAYVQKNCAEMGKYECEDGVCMKKGKLNNAVDTLVIVNTDEYNLAKSDIEKVFQKAEEYWLFPKTQTKFNLLGIEYYSLSKKSWEEWLTEYYLNNDKLYPEYIVVFQKNIYGGGYQVAFGLDYLFNLYNYNGKKEYCSEFKPVEYGNNVIPAAVVDYGHKYALCGYDEKNEKVISEISINGQCLGQEGLLCAWKNGYQMCPNKVNNFYAQDPIVFTANTIVHELLHSYANDSLEYEHFSTVCAFNKLGWDQQNSFDYYLETLEVTKPFDDMTQEYAGICPYVWQQFNNSKQICTE